jgi:dipeptidyl aminopeptidase/acylaminoacyl peptidase
VVLESILKVTSIVIASATVLGLGGPALLEMASTAAPFFGKQADRAADAIGLAYEDVAFYSQDGITLRGWYFQSEVPGAPAILYAPATAKDQRSGLSLVIPLHEAGFNVLLFSYRGHGRSDGNPLGFSYGANESLDVDAAIQYLRTERHVPAIGAIGHSAGAVAIILSAARNPGLDVIVAGSPFASVEEIWFTNKPKLIPAPIFNFMMQTSEIRKDFERDQVRPIDVIDQIAPRPILLIHGTGDRRITEVQIQNLFSQAEEPKQLWMLDGLSHANVRSVGMEEHISGIIRFLDRAISLHLAITPIN